MGRKRRAERRSWIDSFYIGCAGVAGIPFVLMTEDQAQETDWDAELKELLRDQPGS